MTAPKPTGRTDRPRFRETATASGLVDDQQLRAVELAVAGKYAPGTIDPEGWDRAVADALVAQGVLTPFQAQEMLAGRRRFRLGQYTVLAEIGKGGMGQVFRAEHALMGREVAVKVLPRAKSTPESEAAFRREMRMLGRLDHENLVRAFDAGYDAMVYYLVTELVPGMDLKRFVQRFGPLDEATAASVIAQAARGLAHAHEQGLVHRDVKPGNLLVMQDGRVKVLDLGLAGSDIEGESSRLGRVVGTMDYIAPEQIRSPDDVRPSADVYALGCTLYYAVTGRVPFPGGNRKEKMQRHLHDAPESIRQLAPHVSESLCQLVDDMMAKSPERRVPSAAAVVERLKPWLPDGQAWNGRSPVTIDGSAARDAVRPPPLPPFGGGSDRSSGSSVCGLSEESVPEDDDPVAAMRRLGRRISWSPLGRLTSAAVTIALPAAIGIWLAMRLVHAVVPELLVSQFRGATPVGVAWWTFWVLFMLRFAAGAAADRRW
jgi:serine/threonine protein kinase